MTGRVGIALAAFVLACGAPKPPPSPPAPPPPPPVDENLLALAPAAYSQVARIDVASLRASPLWGLSELAMTDQTFAALRGAADADPLPAVDEILITGGNPDGEGTDEILVVAKGRIDAESLAARIAARPAAKGGGDGPPLEAVALTKRTIGLGTKAIVAEAAALAQRKGRSLLEDDAFADLAIGEGLSAVYRFRRGTEALAIDRLRVGPFKGFGWSRNAVSADGSLRLGEGATAEITFVLDDPKVAARARRDLTRMIRQFAGNAIVRLMGVATLLGRIAIAGENERVEIRAELDAADVGQLQTLVERFAQIRELMSEDADDGPVELEPPMLERDE